jgi:hypothetical protein
MNKAQGHRSNKKQGYYAAHFAITAKYKKSRASKFRKQMANKQTTPKRHAARLARREAMRKVKPTET